MISLDVVVKRSPSHFVVYCEDAEQSSIFLNYVGNELDFQWEYSGETVTDDFNIGGSDYSGAYYLLYKIGIDERCVMTYLYFEEVKKDMERYHYDLYNFSDFYEFNKSFNDNEYNLHDSCALNNFLDTFM